MELLGESSGYILYLNSDGFIDGYKKTGTNVVNGQNVGSGLAHISTDCKTIVEFEELMNKKKKIKPKPIKPPELF